MASPGRPHLRLLFPNAVAFGDRENSRLYILWVWYSKCFSTFELCQGIRQLGSESGAESRLELDLCSALRWQEVKYMMPAVAQQICSDSFLRTMEISSRHTWVVVKIMVPFWVPIIKRHLLFRVPKEGPSF